MRHVRVKIVRDQNTVHSTTVPRWEVPVIGFMFDDGNVTETGESVKLDREYPDPAAEFERLATVYGSDSKSGVPHVASVYGNAGQGVRALAKAIAEAKVEDEAEEEAPKPAPTLKRGRRAAADALLS